MNYIESYFNLKVGYKDLYLFYNPELNGEEVSAEKLFYAVSGDVDLVFAALNIMPNKSGYQFWKDAIYLYLLQDKKKINLSIDIYPLIAKKYQTTLMCVDRAMRRCFENVLYFASKHDENYVCAYLKNNILFPHNSEIIAKLVELISSKKFQEKKIKLAF